VRVTVRGDVVPGRSEPRTVSVGVLTVRGDVVPVAQNLGL